jgi:hypothetical protein
MPYNANIPQATDQISDSQNDILQNFESILTLVDVNHVTFDDPNQGKHFLVEMPQQAGPAFAPPAGEVALECLPSAFGANAPTLVYLQNAIPPIEMTSADIVSPMKWSFLPSGLLIKTFFSNVLGPTTGTSNLNPVGAPQYNIGIFWAGFTFGSTNVLPDPNLVAYINTTTTTTAQLTWRVFARDSALVTNPATLFMYTIGI